MRGALTAFARLILRVFFRRVEVAGVEHVPAEGPVMFVLNHPNGLIDPLFILTSAPRPVSFLAKEPLFRWPLFGSALRALDTLPVYRARDNADPKQNARTFDAARAILGKGGSIAIFPEGTTHSDPQMKPLKTGAARIALGAAAEPNRLPLVIVPAGLTYEAKQTFRSDALVCIGPPLTVAHVTLTEAGEPPPDPVHALTTEIGKAIGALVVQAERWETLRAIDAAERIFSADDPDAQATLAGALDLRKRIGEAETTLRFKEPDRLRVITDRVLAHDAALTALGLHSRELGEATSRTGFAIGRVLAWLGWLFMLLPALAGLIAIYLPYRLVGTIANRTSHGETEVVATGKVLAATTLFPLWWMILAGLTWWRGNALAALVVFLASPLLGYVTLLVTERIGGAWTRARAAWLWTTRRDEVTRLRDEQRALRGLLDELAEAAGV